MNKEEIINSYNFRHACKEFDVNKKILRQDLDYLCQVISLSPSSFGLQAFEVLVVENKQLLDKLLPFVWGGQKQLPTASQTFIFLTRRDVRQNDSYLSYIVNNVQNTPSDMQDFRFNLIHNHQINELKILQDERYLDDWLARQVYIALGNVMTAAAQIGIDSCPIEGFVKTEVVEILAQQKLLDKNIHDVSVLCSFGYRKAPPIREKVRKPINELIKFVL